MKNFISFVILILWWNHLSAQIEPIRIDSPADVDSIRQKLIDYIWGGAGFPFSKRTPDIIQYNVGGGVYEGMYDSLKNDRGNLKKIDRLIINLPNGFQSVVYHFLPIKANNKIFIYHAGHANWGFRDEDIFNNNNSVKPGYVIPQLLKLGYSVIAMAMPLYGDPKNGTNNPVVPIEGKGDIKFTTHPQIFQYLNEPYRYFFEPVAVVINYLEDNYSFSDLFAVGLSGGAWTITVYSAIDERIRAVFPVAGSLPLPLRINVEGGGFNDEPGWPEFYNLVNYSELYTMGAFRKNGIHLQITNKYDACCFYGLRSKLYENDVNSAVHSLGEGIFKVEIDTTHNKHQISRWAFSKIVNEVFSNTAPFVEDINELAATEDSFFYGKIKAVDLDSVYGQKLDFKIINGPAWLTLDSLTGEITGTAIITDSTQKSVTIKVSDNQNGTTVSNFKIKIIHINHAPVLKTKEIPDAVEDANFGFQLWGSDKDSSVFSDKVFYYLIDSPSWLKIDSLTGIFSGMPKGIDVGEKEIIIYLKDLNGAETTDTLIFRVKHVNHRPEISSLSNLEAVEDSLFSSTILASDPDSLLFGDRLVYHLVTSPVWLQSDSLTGKLWGTPAGYSDVNDSVMTIKVSDSAGSESFKTISLRISHTNHAPVIVSEADSTVNEDSEYKYRLSVSDQDSLFGDKMSYSQLSTTADWLLFEPETGILRGVPRGKDVGLHQVEFQVNDGNGGKTEQKIVFRVKHVNHSPEISSIPSLDAFEDSLYSYIISVTDIDSLFKISRKNRAKNLMTQNDQTSESGSKLTGKKDILKFSLMNPPSWLNINSEKGWVYGIPSGKNVGDTTAVLVADDGVGGRAIQSWSIKVHHVNHNPFFKTFPDSVAAEDSLFYYQPISGDQDIELFNDQLAYQKISIPHWLFFNENTGELTGKVPVNPESRYEISFRVIDNNGGKKDQTVSLKTRRQYSGKFEVQQNYPNPFQYSTTVKIGFMEDCHATINIFNILGQKVLTTWNNEEKHSGFYYYILNTDLVSGIYFFQVSIITKDNKTQSITKKIVIAR